jgi:hypothetical protein
VVFVEKKGKKVSDGLEALAMEGHFAMVPLFDQILKPLKR